MLSFPSFFRLFRLCVGETEIYKAFRFCDMYGTAVAIYKAFRLGVCNASCWRYTKRFALVICNSLGIDERVGGTL